MHFLTGFFLGLTAGVAATPHCLGMCGGFTLHLARGRRVGLVLFAAGKTCTYMFLGAMAAGVGVIVMRNSFLAPLSGPIRIAAGAIVIVFGLAMLGVRMPSVKTQGNRTRKDPVRAESTGGRVGLITAIFRGLLDAPGPLAGLGLGLAVGFLPCPVPMAMLASAMASQNVLYGIFIMAGVGLGTAPGLLAIGLFGAALSRRFAVVGMRAAGVVVVVIGVLVAGRAIGLIPPDLPIPSCCGGGK